MLGQVFLQSRDKSSCRVIISVESDLVSGAHKLLYLLIRLTNSGYKDLQFRPHTVNVPIDSCIPYASVLALSKLLNFICII